MRSALSATPARTFLLALGLALVAACSRSPDPPEVSANGETLAGAWTGTEDKIAVFRGVPFAAPPVGPLRWRAPETHQARTGVQKADEFAPACMQGAHIVDWYASVAEAFGHGAEEVGRPVSVSEDCLYLNIWTPDISADANLPVMIYVHGGSNKGGWSYEPNYLGDRLAGRGVVVVSIAYRLGPLGFFSHPALDNGTGAPVANFGLEDIRKAFGWVRNNIRGFGGNPDNITGFGESSGAANLLTLALTETEEPRMFDRIIAQSTGSTLAKPRQLSDEQSTGQSLLERFGLGPDATAEQLRELPASDLLKAAEEDLPGHYFSPVLDGTTLMLSPLEALRSGSGSKLDLIIGTNADEWYMYLDADTDAREIEQWVKKTAPEFSGSLLAYASGETDPRKALDRLQTAANMLCPSRFIADLVSAQGGQAYMYYFTRKRGGEGGELLGVYHGAELPYVFDQHDSWLPTEAIDRQLSGEVMDYWIAFARDGNPDSGGPPGWPVFTSTRQYVMELGDQVRIIQPDDAGLCKYLGPVR